MNRRLSPVGRAFRAWLAMQRDWLEAALRLARGERRPGRVLRRDIRLRRLSRDIEDAFALNTILCAGMLAFDASKPLLFRDWEPGAGWRIVPLLGIYALGAIASATCSTLALRHVRAQYIAYLLFGCTYVAIGIVVAFIVGQTFQPGRMSIITVVWHGAFGVFAAIALANSHFLRDVRLQWHGLGYPATASARDAGSADSAGVPLDRLRTQSSGTDKDSRLEIRKELLREVQWSTTIFVQALAAFTAAFGVSMTLLYKDKNTQSPDIQMTAIQMTVGYGVCLIVCYLWGIAPALATASRLRKKWLPPRSGVVSHTPMG